MKTNRYFKNYILLAIVLSVLFSFLFYFFEVINGMFYSAFWGTLLAFAFGLSRYCDKYINTKK